MLAALLLYFCCIVGGEHVTLDLVFSADGARVPSRALLAAMTVGVPERAYELMLDFNSSVLEIERCMYTRSFTYDNKHDSDMVLFEEDDIADPRPHGYYRFPVKQHCTDVGAMPHNFYRNCPGGLCDGVIGLHRESPVWDIWSSFTLLLDTMHLGREHPKHLSPHDKRDAAIECSGSSQEMLCEFDATIAGESVVVDFHTEDSYIYVPRHIYAMYIAGRNLKEISGATLTSVTAARTAQFNAFSRQLEQDSDETDETEWPPLIIRSKGVAIVLDFELLVHSPSIVSSYGNVAHGSAHSFFGERAADMLTLMLKPHPTNPDGNVVSLGNSVLRRYALHKDQLHNLLRVEPRLSVEHFYAREIAAALFLFTYFIYSMLYTLHCTASVALCLPSQCESCAARRKSSVRVKLSRPRVWRILISLGVVLLSLYGVVHASSFISDEDRSFLYWLTVLFVVNAVVVAALLLAAPRRYEPPAGTFCWRAFRTLVSFSASAEHLALVGVLAISLVTRRDNLGTMSSVGASLALFFNAARHSIQAAFYAYALRQRPLNRVLLTTSDLPHSTNDFVWAIYVVGVLIALNFVATGCVTLFYVVAPGMRSANLAILFYIITFFCSVLVLNVYSGDVMRSSLRPDSRRP